MENNKKFDAVQFMRNSRENLSEKYWKHPEVLKKDMQKIREKYKLNLQTPEEKLSSRTSQNSTSANKSMGKIWAEGG